jgi:hypothetical protein
MYTWLITLYLYINICMCTYVYQEKMSVKLPWRTLLYIHMYMDMYVHIYVYQEKMSVKCPEGHVMRHFPRSSNRCCDACEMNIGSSQQAYRCPPCGYDLCIECYKIAQTQTEASQVSSLCFICPCCLYVCVCVCVCVLHACGSTT